MLFLAEKGGQRFPLVLQRCLSVLRSGRVSAESKGCQLCPGGWVLGRTKCYWVSDGTNPWNRSQEDCRNQGSVLLVLWDQDELVKEIMALGMWDGPGAAPGGAGGAGGAGGTHERVRGFPESWDQPPHHVQASPVPVAECGGHGWGSVPG